jgi:AcrR family transcriptional regulator
VVGRRYQLRRRAERQDRTHRRIVEAVVALHEEVGPARTTISAIAERAGVQRLTVYRHFPDESALYGACKARFDEMHPPPDPAQWECIENPTARLASALGQLYAHFRATEPMLANIHRDAPLVPALGPVLATVATYWERVSAVLLVGWEVPDDERQLLAAALGHALEFHTWRGLVRHQGLSDDQSVALMVRLVACAAAQR